MTNSNVGDFPEAKVRPAISWAEVFVNALAVGGLKAVCISPGSRSTPLALAFYAQADIRTYVHLDERSAGFFALGMALATEQPVALLCTSGTAGANYYPAIIEAKMSEVPLVILTTDRPHELRHSGANQTIDQVKMFGDQVLWSVDMALPVERMPAVAWRNLRRMAGRALATADGLRKGPVHLNFPFRKPLEPAEGALWPPSPGRDRELETVRVEKGVVFPSREQVGTLAKLIAERPRGVIVAGPRCQGAGFKEQVLRLAAASGFPILADPLSNLRFGAKEVQEAVVCGAYENYLRHVPAWAQPEIVLRFGAMPTSKRLGDFLARCEGAIQVHVRESGTWADEAHVVDLFLQADPAVVCEQLVAQVQLTQKLEWAEAWRALEERTKRMLAQLLKKRPFDGAFVAEMLEVLPDGARVLAGNSLSVRHVDQFGAVGSKAVQVFANRGASGIDGNISTGMGIAAASEAPVVILVGDVTFYHDSNGLLSARQLALQNVTIVLLNNNGGGIFQRLPIAGFEPPFRELFQAPHELDFASFANTYGFHHQVIDGIEAFRRALTDCVTGTGRCILEIRTNAAEDLEVRREVEQALEESGSL